MKQRLDYIDIAKGIGILAVVYSHSGGEVVLMTYIGGFFIPLFFVLSGFTMKIPEGKSISFFLYKKGQRLLVPYFIFSIVLLLLYRTFELTDFLGILYSRYCLYPFNATDNIYLMNGGRGPLWFLTSMFTAFTAFWFLMKAGKYKPLVAVLYIILTYGLDFLPVLMPWSIDTTFLMAVYLWFGTLLKDMNMKQWKSWHYLLLAVAYYFLCTINGEPNLSVRIYARSVLIILMTGMIGSILVIKVSQYLQHTFFKNIMIEIGRHSLVVFCLQMLLLRIQNEVLFQWLQIPLNGFTLYATSILKTIVAVIVGMYISKGLKRLMPTVF